MSICEESVYNLVDGVLDAGLPFVGSYLQKSLKRPVIIADSIGRIHYPDISVNQKPIESMFIKCPATMNKENYYYHKIDETFFYRVECNSSSAYIMINNLPKESLSQTISTLKEIKLAIKCYFSNLNTINTKQQQLEKQLGEYLFFKSNANIRDIIKLSDQDLDLDKPYFVSIMEIDEADYEVNWELMRAYSMEYVKSKQLDVIPIAWNNCLIAIAPAQFKEDTLEIDPEWPRLKDSIQQKKFIDKKFNIITSKGEGQVYTLAELHKSYNEAHIALTLPRLMGKKGFVQRFSELGVFSIIFSKDPCLLKKYCLGTLNKLIQYDNNNDGELLPTLRIFLDKSLNWRVTSDILHIHVNTLHYRINRIEKLLSIDLSEMNNRVNLYMAIKVWDTLVANGFLN